MCWEVELGSRDVNIDDTCRVLPPLLVIFWSRPKPFLRQRIRRCTGDELRCIGVDGFRVSKTDCAVCTTTSVNPAELHYYCDPSSSTPRAAKMVDVTGLDGV